MNREDKIFCLYFHLKKNTDIVFNVGIGDEDRPHDKTSRNFHWHNTVNKYSYDIEIKHTNLTWESACRLEIAWIKKIGRRDKGLGTLVNKAKGGEGMFDIVHSKEWCEEKSKLFRGNKYALGNKFNVGRKRPDLSKYNRNRKGFVSSGAFKKGHITCNTGLDKTDLRVAKNLDKLHSRMFELVKYKQRNSKGQFII